MAIYGFGCFFKVMHVMHGEKKIKKKIFFSCFSWEKMNRDRKNLNSWST